MRCAHACATCSRAQLVWWALPLAPTSSSHPTVDIYIRALSGIQLEPRAAHAYPAALWLPLHRGPQGGGMLQIRYLMYCCFDSCSSLWSVQAGLRRCMPITGGLEMPHGVIVLREDVRARHSAATAVAREYLATEARRSRT